MTNLSFRMKRRGSEVAAIFEEIMTENVHELM